MRVALYPGSFDPIHLGHVAVIERAAREYDKVVVAVVTNPAKAGFLTVARRVDLARAATAHLDNVRCVSHQGLTVDAARAENADVIVRGAGKEWASEMSMAALNKQMTDIATVMIRGVHRGARADRVAREPGNALGIIDRDSDVGERRTLRRPQRLRSSTRVCRSVRRSRGPNEPSAPALKVPISRPASMGS